jgi:hypothetical protein
MSEEHAAEITASGRKTTREAVQSLFGTNRLVTKAYVIAEVIDVTSGDPFLILRDTEEITQWDKEGMLAYALRIEQGLVTLADGCDDE